MALASSSSGANANAHANAKSIDGDDYAELGCIKILNIQ